MIQVLVLTSPDTCWSRTTRPPRYLSQLMLLVLLVLHLHPTVARSSACAAASTPPTRPGDPDPAPRPGTRSPPRVIKHHPPTWIAQTARFSCFLSSGVQQNLPLALRRFGDFLRTVGNRDFLWPVSFGNFSAQGNR